MTSYSAVSLSLWTAAGLGGRKAVHQVPALWSKVYPKIVGGLVTPFGTFQHLAVISTTLMSVAASVALCARAGWRITMRGDRAAVRQGQQSTVLPNARSPFPRS
jgi:hypothetical protein